MVDIRMEVLSKCRELNYELSLDEVNDFEIQMLCKELKMLPELANRNKGNFSRAEKQIITTVPKMILMEYLTMDPKYANYDYNAMRLFVDLLYRCIINGLEDRNIGMITVKVLYGDVLKSYEVKYNDDSNCSDEYAGVPIFWDAVDELYRSYTSYKSRYKGLDEHSISILGSATEKLNDIEKRKQGRELISYNGIASEYTSVVEHELKRLISKLINKDIKSITFFDAIEKLKVIDSDNSFIYQLSTDYKITQLHWVRGIRNDIDHGTRKISCDEIQRIYKIIIFGDLLDLVSGALCDVY